MSALICADCGKSADEVELNYDHDHATGDEIPVLVCEDCFVRRHLREDERPSDNGASAASEPPGAANGRRRSLTAAEFVAIEREPLVPYISTTDGRSVLFARNTTMEIAGPSGEGKSNVAHDLGSKLAGPRPSIWLGMRIVGGLRVLYVPLPGEGSDEDVCDRIRNLALEHAPDTLMVWDRWRGAPAPLADEQGTAALAAEAALLEIDVIIIDTGPAFFSPAYDCSKGIPEQANEALERIRDLAGRPLAFLINVHTRKADRRTGVREIDELEEIAGHFVKKADGAIVIRKDGAENNTPRRRVVFAKCRKGRLPKTVIATFPPEDSDDPARLTLVADVGGATVKAGTEADTMADWIREHDLPITAADLCEQFEISATTLREQRKPQLEEFGIKRRRLPGRGNAYAYGDDDQWDRVGTEFADTAEDTGTAP